MPVIRQRRVVDIFAATLEAQHFRHVRFQFVRGKASGHAAFLVQDEGLFPAILIHFDTGHAVAFRVHRIGIPSEIIKFAHGLRSLCCPLWGGRGVSRLFPYRAVSPSVGLLEQPLRSQPCFKTRLAATRLFPA